VEPDVVQGHGAKGGLMARLAGAFLPSARRPIVAYTPHGGSFNYRVGSFAHTVYMAAERTLADKTDLFLFESDFIAGRFAQFVPRVRGLSLRAYNGLRATEFEKVALQPDAAELLYIGELREAKGVDTLIETVSRLRARGRTGLRLNVVGSGPDRTAFEAHAARLGLSGAIAFLGPLPARVAFGLGELLIVPSRQESLPYIVLEAAAAAKPIVATSVGGIPEIFGPLAGRLIAPDNVETLVAAIGSALDEGAASRDRLTSQLQAHVANRFSVAAMTDAALAAYREALMRRDAAPSVAGARLRAHS
jgi:glycosyltransferase involved in cell wall biosynthesis